MECFKKEKVTNIIKAKIIIEISIQKNLKVQNICLTKPAQWR